MPMYHVLLKRKPHTVAGQGQRTRAESVIARDEKEAREKALIMNDNRLYFVVEKAVRK